MAATLFGLYLKQRHEMSRLRTELDRLTPANVRATELRLTLLGTRNKLQRLQALEKALPQHNWQQILSRISQSMPEDVWLDRLTFHDGRSAGLAGASYTDSGVYDFVNFLKQVPDIAQIALEGTGVSQAATGPTTNFNLQLTLSNFADRNESEVRRD
jgi:Tfp pilus assembly protein PilN